jgi:hypothetical protein
VEGPLRGQAVTRRLVALALALALAACERYINLTPPGHPDASLPDAQFQPDAAPSDAPFDADPTDAFPIDAPP